MTDLKTAHDGHVMQEYLESRGIQLLTTIPGLIQHNGDESLYDPGLPIRRSARFEKNPAADWTNRSVMDPPSLEWFAPKRTAVESKGLTLKDVGEILRGEK